MSDFESYQATADDIPWTNDTPDTLPYLSPGNGAQPKASPYVWVTWMSKIIAGEAFCEWSLWFRARYSYTKLNAGADLTRWTEEHDDLVRARERDLRLAHVTPRLEQGVTVQGRLATISGKPDIRYEFDGAVFFEDAKTGKHRDSDHVQVLLYIWLWKLQTGRVGRGRVVYPAGVVDVDGSRLSEVERDAIRLLRMAASAIAPTCHPSPNECRSCNIGKINCARRDETAAGAIFKTDAF